MRTGGIQGGSFAGSTLSLVNSANIDRLLPRHPQQIGHLRAGNRHRNSAHDWHASPGCQGTPGFQFTICRSDWNISVPVIFSLQILKCIAWPFGAIVIGDGLGMLQMYRHSGDKWSSRSRETYRRRWSRPGRRSGLDAWSCPSTADRDNACPRADRLCPCCGKVGPFCDPFSLDATRRASGTNINRQRSWSCK